MIRFICLIQLLFLVYIVPFAQEIPPPGIVICKSPSEKLHIGSPSIVKLPNGEYLASHDFFGPDAVQKDGSTTSRIYVSNDLGASWALRSTINGQFWGTLFLHNDAVYIIGTRGSVNDFIIRRSDDQGNTWTAPTDEKNGLLLRTQGNMGYHCAPVPVTVHNGRIWRALEYTPNKGWGMFQSLMLSAAISSDLLDANSWTASNYLSFDEKWHPGYTCWLEGNAVKMPNGDMANLLRVNFSGDDIAAMVNVSADGKVQSFNPATGFITLPGGSKKFSIKYDEKTKRYWSLSNYAPDEEKIKAKKVNQNLERARNTLVLLSSKDLIHWEKHQTVTYSPDIKQHGFQYADWIFDKKDIVAVIRTSFGEKTNGSHDANYLTFQRISNFRKSIKKHIVD